MNYAPHKPLEVEFARADFIHAKQKMLWKAKSGIRPSREEWLELSKLYRKLKELRSSQ